MSQLLGIPAFWNPLGQARWPSLNEQQVVVARVSLLPWAKQAHLLFDVLSLAQRQFSLSIKHPHKRLQSLLGRVLVQHLVSHYRQCAPQQIRWGHTALGKPFVSAENSTDIHINLSHSGDYVVVAISSDYEMGVDLERERDLSDCLGLAERFLHLEDWNYLASLTDIVQRKLFFKLWSRHEAVLKAEGTGWAGGSGHGKLRLMNIDAPDPTLSPVHLEAGNFLLYDLPFEEGYAAALAIHGTPSYIHCHDWTQHLDAQF